MAIFDSAKGLVLSSQKIKPHSAIHITLYNINTTFFLTYCYIPDMLMLP